MLDKAYIQELRDAVFEKEMSNREAKDALYDYATSFNVELKKTRSFENMVLDFDESLKELADVPMPDAPEGGINTVEVIDMAETLKPQDDVVGVIDEDIEEPVVVNIPTEAVIEPTPEPVQEIKIIAPTELKLIDVNVVFEQPKSFELPENYTPTVTLMGPSPGYCTLPWWIYDWITQNPDWKERPHDFTRKHEIGVLLSLIYYIKRDASVKIRESRNSRFYILQ